MRHAGAEQRRLADAADPVQDGQPRGHQVGDDHLDLAFARKKSSAVEAESSNARDLCTGLGGAALAAGFHAKAPIASRPASRRVAPNERSRDFVANLMASRLTSCTGSAASARRRCSAPAWRIDSDEPTTRSSSFSLRGRGDPVGDLLDVRARRRAEASSPPARWLVRRRACGLDATTRQRRLRHPRPVRGVLPVPRERTRSGHADGRAARSAKARRPARQLLLGVREDALAQLDASRCASRTCSGTRLRSTARPDRREGRDRGSARAYNELVPEDEAVVATPSWSRPCCTR